MKFPEGDRTFYIINQYNQELEVKVRIKEGNESDNSSKSGCSNSIISVNCLLNTVCISVAAICMIKRKKVL